jgi:predicted NBD/HSP70 family sugar kinase
MSKASTEFYGIDVGGTNLRCAKVDAKSGKLLGPVVTRQMCDIASNRVLTDTIRNLLPADSCNVGVCAAGLIDEEKKVIRNSPNMKIPDEITFASDLAKLGFNVEMGNDMATSVLAAALYGDGRGYRNVALGTFSSGSNYAVVRDGQLGSVRMEASHYPAPLQAGLLFGWLGKDSNYEENSRGPAGFPHLAVLAQLRQYFFIRGSREAHHPLLLKGLEIFNKTVNDGMPAIAAKDLETSAFARAAAISSLSPTFLPDEGPLVGEGHNAADFETLLAWPRLFCGCGGLGHIEPYLSGNGAASMAQQYFAVSARPSHRIIVLALQDYNRKAEKEGWSMYEESTPDRPLSSRAYIAALSAISAKHVYAAYEESPDESPQKHIRDTQVRMIASSFGTLLSHHNPLDRIICMGSMTNNWSCIFGPAIASFKENQTGQFYLDGIKSPQIVRNTLDDIGIIGGVAYLVSKQGR